MRNPLLTIFTPSYNRLHTLPRLLESLQSQSCKNFEWLVIDDGSTDSTSNFFETLNIDSFDFNITYIYTENGGKNRAINKGLALANGKYFMILDSDDVLTQDAVDFILNKIQEIENENTFIGISGRKADLTTGIPLGYFDNSFTEEGFIDCNNLDRNKYGLDYDMAEVFITKKLRNYKFDVWKNEKFTPEEVIWNQIALDGYKLRWFNKIIYMCEYQTDGLTASSWALLKNNPIGYSMMYNQRIFLSNNIKQIIINSIQYSCCCILGKKIMLITKSCLPFLTIFLSPVAWILSCRRHYQFKHIQNKK